MRLKQCGVGLSRTVGWIGLVLSVLWSYDASALDCAKAVTPVERAICADPRLKAVDAELSEQYFSVLARAKMIAEITGNGNGRHDSLIKSQRAFISQREKDCVAPSLNVIGDCILGTTTARAADLDSFFGGEGDFFGREGDPVVPRDYAIARETITVVKDPSMGGEESMRYKDAKLLEANKFYFLDIWKSAPVTAILVDAYSGGTDQCRSLEVVDTRKLGIVTATNLGDGCAFGPRWHVGRTTSGFSFETAAQPLNDGSVTEWDATTGAVATRSLKFAPEPGLTIERLLQRPHPQYQDPLLVAEFYDAARSLPDPDSTRVIQALWNIGGACDCNSEDQLNLYGAKIETDIVAYSGCGWFLRPSTVSCSDTDALAVWDRKIRNAYFAVDDHIVGGLHAKSPKLKLYPALDQWSPQAAAKLGTWKNGKVWDPPISRPGHP